jgi:N-acyl homoserine lactone hydrolase
MEEQVIRITPVESAFMTTDTATLCAGGTGRVRIPVSCWIVEHPKGMVIFDTGLHADLTEDTSLLGVLDNVFEIEMKQDLAGQIRDAGIDPARIDYIVFSHLHFDHSGGTAAITNGRIVVQQAEWRFVQNMTDRESVPYTTSDYNLGHDVQQIEGFHDIFGDATVVCIPTPGDTPGHQSLRVRLESGDVMLVGDCCNWRRMLDEDLLPPFGFDGELQRKSMQILRDAEASGARLMFGHDPDQWQETVGKSLT